MKVGAQLFASKLSTTTEMLIINYIVERHKELMLFLKRSYSSYVTYSGVTGNGTSWGATSFSKIRNQQRMLFLSNTIIQGIPI